MSDAEHHERPGAATPGAQTLDDDEADIPRSSDPLALGHYRIVGAIGSGGMGRVYEGFDPRLDRRVAIKVLHREVGEQQTTRMFREAQAMAKLSHPNVVQVYEVDTIDGQTFVAMELVAGETLRQWVQQELRPDWRACVETYIQAGQGLAAAHDADLVHRDFKPSNAMIDERGRVRVLDFGLARQASVLAQRPTNDEIPPLHDVLGESSTTPLQAALTRTGALLGTPAYMPLEQLRGHEADARSDQFSFCVALWEAVYAQRPFDGDSMAVLVVSLMEGEIPVPPAGTHVPGALRKILQRGLSREPEERWPTMEALLNELRQLVAPRGWRRGVIVGALAGGLAIAGVLAASAYVERSQRCTGARDALAGVWDDTRRTAVHDAIAGTDLPFSQSTEARVRATLDAYADQWAAARIETCEATFVHRTQTEADQRLRMDCLDERSTAVAAVVDVLAQADDTVVRNAVKLTTSLPSIASCDDVRALAAQRRAVPPPEAPQTAREVKQLRAELAQLEAMQHAGSHARALESIEAVVERAEALEYGPLVAEVVRLRGVLRRDAGRYSDAEKDLTRAYEIAVRHDHERAELGAARNLALVVGVYLRRPAEGLLWGRAALPLAKRIGEPVEVASTMNYLGDILHAQGEAQEAEIRYREAFALFEEARGPEHPDVARAMNDVGVVLLAQGKFEEAEAPLRRALELLETALGPDHPHVAIDASNLGSVLGYQGKFEEAEAQFRRALAIDERVLPPSHPGLAMSVSNVGSALKAQGKLEEAEVQFRRALEIFETVPEEDRPDTSASVEALGVVLHEQGRHAEAQARLTEVVQLRVKAHGAEHPRVATSRLRLSEAALGAGDVAVAREQAEAALRSREAGEEPAPAVAIAEAKVVLAAALWGEPGERRRARELAEGARDVFAGGPESAEELEGVEAWLAEHPLP